MAELSKIFKSSQELTDYLNGENIPSNVLGVVVEDETVKEIAFGTNDIEGEYKTYRITDEYPTPTGTINITENGENIDVKQYATANVSVPTVTTTGPTLLTLKSYDEYTLPHRSSVPITLNEGDYVLDGDIITYTVDIDFDSAVLANETSAIIAKQGNNILPITIQRKGASTTMFTLTASYDIVAGSYIDLYYYVISSNYKLCTIGIE